MPRYASFADAWSQTLTRPPDPVLRAHSPRFSRAPTPWASLAIHGAVAGLWLLLVLRAFAGGGLFAWSAGLAYVGYDTALLAFVFWRTRELAWPRPAAPSQAQRVSLGVLVAAHNEAAVLPATIAALVAQTDPPDAVVIADDGSDDATATMLAGFGLEAPAVGALSAPSSIHPSLRWLRLAHGGKARALNAAIRVAETEVLLTVDADTLLDPGAIAAMRRAFSANAALVAATGVLAPFCGPGADGRVFEWFQTYEYIRNFLSRHAWARLDSLLLISGAFAGFRRQALLDVGGFDADCLVEDYELIHRLLRHSAPNGLGWTTAVLGNAKARTEAPGSIPAFLSQRRRWFGGFLQTQFWYRDMVGNRRFGWLGMLMLPVKAVDTLQPIYGLTALALLLFYLATGQAAILFPVIGVMAAKIAIDLAFHVWSLVLYRRWTGDARSGHLGASLLAAIAEPFTFQILRHTGAALGWFVFLTGRQNWGARVRRAGGAVLAER